MVLAAGDSFATFGPSWLLTETRALLLAVGDVGGYPTTRSRVRFYVVTEAYRDVTTILETIKSRVLDRRAHQGFFAYLSRNEQRPSVGW